ncbi:MAG: insulinase family protein [Alphaproteobacteria bacterium]|nr:insulinase family protein [Alphaproteobacteria bacterium]
MIRFLLTAIFMIISISSVVFSDTNTDIKSNNLNKHININKVPKTALNKKADNTKNIIYAKELKSYRGIKFFYAKDNSSQLVHVKISFDCSGSAYQEKQKAGVPAFYASTVTEGCGSYSSIELKKEISAAMAYLSSNYDMDKIWFNMTTPTLTLEKTAKLLNTVLRDPKFEEDKIKMYQDSKVAALQNYSISPAGSALHQIAPAIIFPGHAYGNGLAGSAEDFAKLTVNDLHKYRKKFIVANNAQGCVFGNISEEQAKRLIDKIFDKIDDGKKAKNIVVDIEPKIFSLKKQYYVNGPISLIIFILKGTKLTSPNRFPARIFSTIFGEGSLFKGRLMGILRGKGYIYGGSINTLNFDHSDYILGMLETDNSKVEAAITTLKGIIKDFREKGITESELQFAKNLLKGSTVVGLRSSGSLCGFFFTAMRKGLGVNALSDFLDGIDKVTIEEVNGFCKNNLNENDIPFIIMGGNIKGGNVNADK